MPFGSSKLDTGACIMSVSWPTLREGAAAGASAGQPSRKLGAGAHHKHQLGQTPLEAWHWGAQGAHHEHQLRGPSQKLSTGCIMSSSWADPPRSMALGARIMSINRADPPRNLVLGARIMSIGLTNPPRSWHCGAHQALSRA